MRRSQFVKDVNRSIKRRQKKNTQNIKKICKEYGIEREKFTDYIFSNNGQILGLMNNQAQMKRKSINYGYKWGNGRKEQK